jgi:ribosomal protein S18
MGTLRSAWRGGTDYTGVPLDDICVHLRAWRESTRELIHRLKNYESQVTQNVKRIEYVDDVKDFILLSIDLFSRFLSDYDRLLAEIPTGVTEAHVEIISQIVRRSDYHEKSCVQFKHDHIERNLKDESMRQLLDRIYSDTANEIVNYSDLHNVIPRLRTYIGSRPKGGDKYRLSAEDADVLELKPNVFGIGLNLNYVIKRLRQIFQKKI